MKFFTIMLRNMKTIFKNGSLLDIYSSNLIYVNLMNSRSMVVTSDFNLKFHKMSV
jgi:hypothetical protein